MPSADITAVWDLRYAPVSLGSLLLFVSEIEMRRQNAALVSSHIKVLVPSAVVESWNAATAHYFEHCLELLRHVRTIQSVEVLSSLEELTLPPCGAMFWPHHDEPEERDYLSTIPIAQLYKEGQSVAPVLFSSAVEERGRAFLQKFVGTGPWGTLHLKQVSNDPLSNADFRAWQEALTRAERTQPEVRFVLVGKDPIPMSIRRLKNAIISSDFGEDILRDLWLIPVSDFFMGMTSGPCQMAVLGTKPYCLYKSPDHHPSSMLREIGVLDRFPFAGPHQYIRRLMPSCERILHDLEILRGALANGEARA